jgi:hypothetical protein
VALMTFTRNFRLVRQLSFQKGRYAMRYFTMIALTCFVLAGSASAQTAGKPEDGRDVHPPTGRLSAEVPTMTTEAAETHEQKETAEGKEEVHPPTGRVGKAVPPMTSDAPEGGAQKN